MKWKDSEETIDKEEETSGSDYFDEEIVRSNENKQVKKGKVDLKNNRYVANYIENDSTDIDNDALILSDDDSYTLSDDDDLTINLLNN